MKYCRKLRKLCLLVFSSYAQFFFILNNNEFAFKFGQAEVLSCRKKFTEPLIFMCL